MNEVTIECRLEFERYLKLMYSIVYQKPIMLFMPIVGILMLFFSIGYYINFLIVFNEPPLTQLIMGIMFTFLLPISIYIQAKKSFVTNARLTEVIKYTFNQSMIYIKGESFKSEMTWDKLFKIKEMKNWVLIYPNKHSFHLIPKDSFNLDQMEQFRKIAGQIKCVRVDLKK